MEHPAKRKKAKPAEEEEVEVEEDDADEDAPHSTKKKSKAHPKQEAQDDEEEEEKPVDEHIAAKKKEFAKKVSEPGGELHLSNCLKDALSICIDNTIKIIGETNGYFHHPNIKILIPQKFNQIADLVRELGFGHVIDDFEHSLNKAAEKAAPASKHIVIKAVTDMHLKDATRLWKGVGPDGKKSQSAISDYFHKDIGGDLAKAFSPIIDKAIEETSVTHHYNQIRHVARDIPFVSDHLDVNINQYANEKAIDGLFFVLKQEEVKVRKDPAGQVVDLLKMLF